MGDTAVATGGTSNDGRCSCCGESMGDDRLVRLHCRSDVGVCFRCLDWLNRQRNQKRAALVRAALPSWVPERRRRTARHR